VTQKNWKHHGGVPEFEDFRIRDRDSWAEARRRMTPSEDRVDWTKLERDYPAARQRGDLIVAAGWFGFDVTHSWICGTERILMALVEDPDWCGDMFMHELDTQLALFDLIRQRGYEFDLLYWPDDLGYRNGPLFSPAMYRDILQPVHAKACDWAHTNDMKVLLHSCGNVMDLVPDLLDAGIDCLNPLEQKAGMDAIGLKRDYAGRLALMGGIDVREWAKGGEALEHETLSKLEALMPGGGYIFHSDHSVPENVSFADYCRVVELAKAHGRYE
jgi:uroporphyrinogen decarboxylase